MAVTRLPGTPRLLRALNDRAALELLLDRGPLTRGRLGELTGLSKVTAAQLVERLEERGLVRRVGRQPSGRGPNAQLYAVAADTAYAVGVQVAADRVVAACADLAGDVGGRVELPLSGPDPAADVRAAITAAAGRAGAQPAAVRRIVLGVPADRLSWHRDLAGVLLEGLRTPTVLLDDVSLTAVAEARLGAARGVDDFVLLRVGPGVGLAVVVGGRLHQGGGYAGQIGRLVVPDPRHPGGVRFEALLGADALAAVGGRHGLRAPGVPADAPAGAADGPPGTVTGDGSAAAGRADGGRTDGGRVGGGPADGGPAGVVRAAAAAGPAGEAVLDEVADRIAVGLAAACVVLAPPLVVLAGTVAAAGGAALAARVAARVATGTPPAPAVAVAAATVEPVLHGALHTALDAVRDEVFGSTTL